MCYIVYQKTGILADYAKQYTALRLSGNMRDAIALYRKAVDDNRPLGNQYGMLPDADSVWWIYNADSAIRKAYKFTDSEWSKILSHSSDKSIAYAIANLAKYKYGGEWVIEWEY